MWRFSGLDEAGWQPPTWQPWVAGASRAGCLSHLKYSPQIVSEVTPKKLKKEKN